MVSLTTATTALNTNQEMTDFDYKKYSLENLENWLHDAMSSAEATPQEIYGIIKKVVSENYYYHKDNVSKSYELLSLLNGNDTFAFGLGGDSGGVWTKQDVLRQRDYYEPITFSFCNADDKSPECVSSWNSFWNNDRIDSESYVSEDGDLWVKDRVVKWQLPVEVDGASGDYYVQFPDDLLEAANLKEGDSIEWIDRKDGSFELRKVNGTK